MSTIINNYSFDINNKRDNSQKKGKGKEKEEKAKDMNNNK